MFVYLVVVMGARVYLGLSGLGCSSAVLSGLGLWVLALGLAFLVTFNAGASDRAAHSEREVTTPEAEEKGYRDVPKT